MQGIFNIAEGVRYTYSICISDGPPRPFPYLLLKYANLSSFYPHSVLSNSVPCPSLLPSPRPHTSPLPPNPTQQLYHARFVPLKRVVDVSTPHKHKPHRNPWLHWAGVALLTYGGLAAAGLTHRHLAKQGKSPLGPVLKDPVAQAVVNTVDAVGQSAVNLVSTAAEAVQDPGQAAAVIKQAAKKGVSATVQGSSQVAAAVGRGVDKVKGVVAREGEEVGSSSGSEGVVHGEVPSRRHRSVFTRARDVVVKRTLSVGAFLSRPFTHVLGHQVRGTVAETLGAF